MARKIFRQGEDIFSLEGDSARKLGSSEFEKSFAPQAGTVVEPGGEVRKIGEGDVEDLGQREDLFNQFFPQPKTTGVVGIDDEASKITDGTDSIRDESTLLRNRFGQIINDPTFGGDDKVDSQGQISDTGIDLTSEFEKLKTDVANISTESDAELRAIEEAGEAAGEEFEDLIAEARERAKQGQARAVVATGRRGGFQRARFAGQAALGPTEGDVGFAGAGGKLEASESAFQRNIDNLKAQQRRAISLAKTAARKALREGKQADFENARKIFDTAKQLQDDVKQKEQDMFDNLFKLRQEARQEATATFNIVKNLPEGQTIDIQGQQFTGIAKSDVDPFFTGSNIISLMKALPAGQETSITDPNTGREMTLFGLQTDDPSIKTIQSTSDSGEVTITSYRLTPDGGAEVINQAGAGRIGKTKTQAPSVTIVQQQQQAGDLGDATARLEATKGADGFFNTDAAIKEISEFSIKNPGKRQQIIDVIKNNLNPNDPKARTLITGKIEKVEEGKGIKITNPSGITFEIN